MLKRTKHLRWVIVVMMVVTVGVLIMGGTVSAAEELNCKEGEIKLNVPFGKSCVSDIGDYISVLYRYMVGAIGIVGVAMIMYGGIRWVASNGNSREIDEAKQTIISAIVGVVLALGSWVLLNFLNPMITQLKNPLEGHSISGTDTTVFCSSKLGSGWKTKVKWDNGVADECGTVFTEVSGGQTCTSDFCFEGKICYNDLIGGTGLGCADAETICKSAGDSCDQIDAQIARFQPDFGCSKRYNNDFLSAIINYITTFEVGDKCVYGAILKPDSGWTVTSCTTPAARNICFGIAVSGEQFPLDCARSSPALPFNPEDNYNSFSHPCIDKSRPVEGADGICIFNGDNQYRCKY